MTNLPASSPLYRHTMQRLEEVKRLNSQGDDYWSAREIFPLLGYASWDGFQSVMSRAEAAIANNGGNPSHHIAHTTKMVTIGDGAKRRVKEAFLSRGACYLLAMNGDPSKPEIAGAQTYFAGQTRRAELADKESDDLKRVTLRDRVTMAVKRVSDVAHHAGVSRYALFHAARFEGLYGKSKRTVDAEKGLEPGEALLDRAGALELSTHEFQMQLASAKIANEGINGEQRCIDANLAVAKTVRETIVKQTGRELLDVPLEKEPIQAVRKRLRNQRAMLSKG